MSTGLHENPTQVMDKPAYPNSNSTLSSARMSRGIYSERKNSSSYRRERARELQRLSLQHLVDLVLRGEHKIEKTEARLKKYVLNCKEQADAEKHALEQMKRYQQKMTQIILDAQQESVRARHDVEQYKLKLENAQHEIQRGQEAVKLLEEGKEQTERALTRARDKAREYREQTAVQLAREQGRRLGFEQGFEQGRLVFQLAHARASKNQVDVGLRRALTQGPDAGRRGGERHRRSLGQRNSLDQTRDSTSAVSNSRPPTQRLSAGPTSSQQNPSTSRSSRPPGQLPREFLQQAPSDGSVEASASHRVIAAPPEVPAQAKSEESQSRTTASSSRPPRQSVHGSQPAGQVERSKASGSKRPANPLQDSTYMPIPAPGPAPLSAPSQRSSTLPVPPARQFPAGVPLDNVSEASTSPASTVTGIDIVTFRDSTIPKESSIRTSKKTRDQISGPSAELPVIPKNVSSSANGGHPVGPAPSTSRSGSITQPPVEPVHPAPVVPDGLLNPPLSASNWSSSSPPRSNRSSTSWEFSFVPPSQPSSPPHHQTEEATEENGLYLSPNSGPTSLPRVQSSVPDPRESPVLPVLPRIVSQPTTYGTPDSTNAVIPNLYTQPGLGNDPANYSAVVYEEAPTPPGFHYPVPLGAAATKGKGGSVAFSDDGPRHPSYSSSPAQSPAGGFYAAMPASGSYATQSDSPSQPVIPSVVPGGIYQGSPRAGNDSYNDPDEDTSFDSATKRNTQMNAQMYDSW